jgi:enamine deaminase RidA (YjgF/YER057c/UK114 family)
MHVIRAYIFMAFIVGLATCARSPAFVNSLMRPLALKTPSVVTSRREARPSLTRSIISMAGNGAIQCIEPGPRMSSACVHNGLVYTAGCVCEEGGETKDMKQQAVDALADLDRTLELAGSDKHHIMSMQVSTFARESNRCEISAM